jgi:hypothetical protein
LGSVPNNEDAVAEDTEGSSPGATPSSPFARRVSFGAQALREARAGSIGNGRYPPPSSSLAGARRTASTAVAGSSIPGHSPSSSRSPASASSSAAPLEERSNASRRPGEGFNWTEALRHRAERAPSIGAPVSPNSGRNVGHQRAASIATMEQPVREIPKQPKQNKPDFFQEKILRGDFMD